MSLSKRLGKAAATRTTGPASVEVLEPGGGRTAGIGIDVTGTTPAIDLRTARVRGAAPTSRFALRRQRLAHRDAKLAEQRPAVEAPHCPRCGTKARIDIDDRTRGTLHLSCDACFNMWQAPGAPPAAPPG